MENFVQGRKKDLMLVQEQALSSSAGRGGANWRGSVSAGGSEVAGLMHGPTQAPQMHGPIQRNFTGRGAYGGVSQWKEPKAQSFRRTRKAYGMMSSKPGKIAMGAGLAVGALALADSAIGRDPFSDAGSIVGGAQRFNRSMNEAARPSYGNSQFQQSTQGLVFGLHNSRTAH
jgi:hypothetical protein